MKLLFVCKGNVCRSQMAEAFYEKLSKNKNVKSAGYSPENLEGKSLDNTKYVKFCMDGEDINVRNKVSKKIDIEMVDWADKIIVFDSKKMNWPDFLRNLEKVEVWDIEDPRHGDLEFHRKTMYEIKKRIIDFVERNLS